MGQVLHGSATTTEAVRRAIQLRQESVRALAKRYGVSPTTVQKWRKRSTGLTLQATLPHSPALEGDGARSLRRINAPPVQECQIRLKLRR